jgi:hypothetical protein
MKHLKRINELNDFNWDDVLKDGREPKSKDKWSELEKDMMELVEKYKGDFGVDSYGVVDAMYQVMDGMFQKRD